MKDINNRICINCFNIVTGLNKTEGAAPYRIRNKIYCSLTCFYEIEEKKKESLNKKIGKKDV